MPYLEKSASKAESPDELLATIRRASDLATVAWAASALETRVLLEESAVPQGAEAVLTDRLAGFSPDTEGHALEDAERVAASALLGALLELVRTRPGARKHVRGLLVAEGSTWLGALFCVMAGPGAHKLFLSIDRTTRHARPPRPTPPPQVASPSLPKYGVDGGAAFVHACHLLTSVAVGDEEIAKVLVSAHALDLVGGRLLCATTGGNPEIDAEMREDLGTEWLPFATAAMALIDALINAEDDDRFCLAEPKLFRPGWVLYERANVTVDACVAALKRSLRIDGGSMVAQQLHLSGLRALSRIAQFNDGQAHRIMSWKALGLGADVLRIAGVDEEAVLAALRFLAEVAAPCPFSHRQLAACGAAEAASHAVGRYPRSEAVRFEATRVHALCAGGGSCC